MNSYNNRKNGNFDQNKQNLDKAFAPYNFVPLNEKVVEADVLDFNTDEFKDKNGLSKFSANLGFIDLEIKTLTPFFIGDSAKGKQAQEFFNIGGKYKIPGSSLRGMVRTLVEICSYSKFTNFNDSKFYFRDVAGKSESSLKSYYLSIMTGTNKIKNFQTNKTKQISILKSKAGFLQQLSQREFQIIPTTYKKVKFKDDDRYKDIPFSDLPEMTMKIYNGKYEVYVGKMSNSKSFYVFDNPQKDVNKISLKYSDIKNYKYDNEGKQQRNKEVELSSGETIKLKFLDLLKWIKATKKGYDGVKMFPNGIPCFYTEYKGQIFFGHTPYFRIPYQNSVGDLIPQFLKETSEFDLAEAIFGKDGILSSRVYFEDGVLQNEPKFCGKQEIVLSLPKPTSYNLYLDQSGAKEIKYIKHYDSIDTKIRGYKMYHHQNFTYKIPSELEYKANLIKTIKPLDKGNVFKARIRFESLNDIELGALMFVLNLPDGHHHKIGMAKPLGLGSVAIKATLSLHDLENRYSKFMDKNSEFFEPLQSSDKDFVKEFERFILEKISSQNKTLWDENRLKELKAMLKFDLKKSYDYMELEYFKHKDKILPKATELK